MSYGITVVGLVQGLHTIEDIRVAVPFRTAVHIPLDMVKRSRDLQRDLQLNKLMKMAGSLPVGATFRGLGAVPRATNAVPSQIRNPPPPTTAEIDSALTRERDILASKLEDAEALNVSLSSQNTSLQTTLTLMSGQLENIQGLLESLKKRGVSIAGVADGSSGSYDYGEEAPRFIPERIAPEGVDVTIQVQEESSDTDLGASKNALRTLRRKGS